MKALAGFLGGIGICMLLGMAAIPALQRMQIVGNVQLAPHPRDFVLITDNYGSISYTVPPGKKLMVTAIGAVTPPQSGIVNVFVDRTGSYTGSLEYFVKLSGQSMVNVPPGFIVHSGETITVGVIDPNYKWGRVYGYLVDE